MRDDLERQRADGRNLWQRFLDAPARWQVGLFIGVLLVTGGIINAVRNEEAPANPHDVIICNSLNRLNDLASSGSPSDPEVFAILDNIVAEGEGASAGIKAAVSTLAEHKGTFTDLDQARAQVAADVQALVDACNETDVPNEQ